MANLFLNLPTNAANGPGTAVDVSAMGATKTIVVGTTTQDYGQPFVTIEIANDAGGAEWSEIYQFKQAGEKTLNVAARWMRANVSQYRNGSAPEVDVGSDDAGTLFATLVAPAGNGNGAAVDTSSLGLLKTVQVTGTFRGTLNIEISEDGGTTWAEIATFVNAGGVSTAAFAADFMRVARDNVPVVNPGTPVINVGAAELGGGGKDLGIALAAGTQTASTGTVTLSNFGGVNFGMAGSATVTGRVASMSATGAENALITGSSNGSMVVQGSVLVSAVTGGLSLIAGATSDSEGMLMSAAQDMFQSAGDLLRVSAGGQNLQFGAQVAIHAVSDVNIQNNSTGSLGFFGTTPIVKPSITGASTNATLVLNNLLNALASYGLLNKQTT